MANRNFPSKFTYSFHLMPVAVDASVNVGASGAPTLNSQLGIQSITRLSAGRYRIQLQDNYARLLDFSAIFIAAPTGSAVADGSFSVGTVYSIASVGTTNWASAGLPAGITPAVGVTFKAATVGGAGSGTAQAIGTSGIASCELLTQNSNMLNNQPFQAFAGGFVDFQCLAPTSSSVTTMIPTDPANGSIMRINLRLNNSSVQ